MAVSEVLRSIAHVLRSLLRKPASEALLLDNYATTCLALDEMIYEVRSWRCSLQLAVGTNRHLVTLPYHTGLWLTILMSCNCCLQGILESTDRIEALSS